MKYGSERMLLKFLFFPRKINGKWHWLRYYCVFEKYEKDACLSVNNYTDEIEGYVDGWIEYKINI